MRLATLGDEERVRQRHNSDAAGSGDKEPDILDILGLGLLLFFSLFSMAAMLLASLSQFIPAFLALSGLAISLSVGLLLWMQFHAAVSKTLISPLASAIAILALATCLVLPPAEFVLGGWDAGVYYNTGIALAEHGSLTWKDEFFESLPREVADSLADSRPQLFEYLLPGFFIYENDEIKSHFPMLLSVWIGILTLVGGNHFALFTPSLLALLAISWFYLFARYIFDSKWAFVASLLLMTNTVQIWHARQTLSEVALQGLIFGSLAAAMFSLRHSIPSAAIAAGLGFGALPLVKTEATFVSVIFMLFFSAATVLTGRQAIGQLKWSLGSFMIGMLFSAGYYFTEAKMYVFEQIAASWLYIAMGLVLVAVAAASVAALARIRPNYFPGKMLSIGVFSAACLGLLGSASLAFASGGMPHVVGLWIALWDGLFLSPLDGLLIILGLCLVARRSWQLQRPQMDVTMLLIAAAIASLLYLGIYVSYVRAKEEIALFFWATRRLVPIIIPLLSLLMAFSLFKTVQFRKEYTSVLASFSVAIILLFRLPDILPVMQHTEYKGSVEQIDILAGSIEDNSIVLFDNDDLGLRLSAPFRFLHQLPSYIIWNSNASLGTLLDRAAESGRPVVFIASRPGASLAHFDGYRLDPYGSFHLELPEWERTSQGRPSKANSFASLVNIFKVRPDAQTEPVLMPIKIEAGSNTPEEYQFLGGDLFPAEVTPSSESYRWVGHQLLIAIAKTADRPLVVAFMAAGGRPNGITQPLIQVTCGALRLKTISLVYDFQRYEFEVPSDCMGEIVMITANTWTPKEYGISTDNRALGFMLAWVELGGQAEAN